MTDEDILNKYRSRLAIWWRLGRELETLEDELRARNIEVTQAIDNGDASDIIQQ